MRNQRHTVSSAPPGYYARRFIERMNEYIQPALRGDREDAALMQEIRSFDWDQYDFYQ